MNFGCKFFERCSTFLPSVARAQHLMILIGDLPMCRFYQTTRYSGWKVLGPRYQLSVVNGPKAKRMLAIGQPNLATLTKG